MQSVGNFDEHHPHIFNQSRKYFLEILSLFGRYIVETIEFSETVNNMTDLISKLPANILDRHLGIFDDIVEERAHRSSRSKTDLTDTDTGYFDRMEKIGFTTLASLPGVSFKTHVEGLPEILFVGLVQRGRQSLHQPAKFTLQGQLFSFGQAGGCMWHNVHKVLTKVCQVS